MVQTAVRLPLSTVWQSWTAPVHITGWNAASDDWHTPVAENELRAGGRFRYRMEARDGSAGFDFCGTYDSVLIEKQISCTLDDDRKVTVQFELRGDSTVITETFEAENLNSVELQRTGWQAILDNFKRYTESVFG